MNKKINLFYKQINFFFFILFFVIILFIILCVEIFYKKEFSRFRIYGLSERQLKLHLLKNNLINNVILGPSSSTTMNPDIFNQYKLNNNGIQNINELEVSKNKNLNLSIGGGTIKEFYSYIKFLTKKQKTKIIVLNLRVQSFQDGFDYKNMPIDFPSSLDEFSSPIALQNYLEKNLSDFFSSRKVKFIVKKLFLNKKEFEDMYNKKNITEEEYSYKGIRFNPDFFIKDNAKVSTQNNRETKIKNIRETKINLNELDVNFSKNFKYLKKIINLCNAYNIDLFIVFDPLAINKLAYMSYLYQKKEIELIKLILDIYPEVYYFNNNNLINNDLKYFPFDWVHYNYDAANIVLIEVLSGDLKNGIKLNKEKLILLESKLFKN